MPKSNVTRIAPRSAAGASADLSMTIPERTLQAIAGRPQEIVLKLWRLESTMRCLSVALESDERVPEDTAHALRGLCEMVDRFDGDISSWWLLRAEEPHETERLSSVGEEA